MNFIPLNKITTGCIGVNREGRKIFFIVDDYDNKIKYKILHSFKDDIYMFNAFYNEVGNHSQPQFDLVQIYNPLKVTEDNILQAELLWERGVEWENVPVDTPIFVRDNEDAPWLRRHFAFYKEGKVYAFADGFTSFTSKDHDLLYPENEWNYAKLAKENK